MRSVTSMLPSGSQPMPQGVSRPSATTSSLNVSSWLWTTMPSIGAGGFAVARVRSAFSCSSWMKITSARISCSLNAALNDGIGVGGRPSRMLCATLASSLPNVHASSSSVGACPPSSVGP